MRKRNENNGDRFRKKRINLTHLAGKKKWRPFLEYLHELTYVDDRLGHSGFIQECLIPSNVEINRITLEYFPQRFLFRGKAVVRVFYKKKLPEELTKALMKCLECQ
jgi:hypothetical protein